MNVVKKLYKGLGVNGSVLLDNLVNVGILFKVSCIESDLGWNFNQVSNLIYSKVVEGSNVSFRVNRHAQSPETTFVNGSGWSLVKLDEHQYAILQVSWNNVEKQIFGSSSTNINMHLYGLRKHIESARKLFAPLYEDMDILPAIYDGEQRKVGYIPDIYKLQKQFVEDDVYKIVTGDVERMLAGRDWYNERLRPYKECFLLYGSPRTGKSNLVRHIAGKYGLDVYLVRPEKVGATGLSFTSSNGKPIILLFEDIDSSDFLCTSNEERIIINNRGKENQEQQLTEHPNDGIASILKSDYSAFINFLGGIVPLDNVIIFMTTNYIEKLKESVIGKGRVDRKVNVDYLGLDKIREFVGDDPIYSALTNMSETDYVLGTVNAANLSELIHATSKIEVDEIIARK